MTIYGISQSAGVERRLRLDRAGLGILLTIIEHVGDVERERIIVPADAVLNSIMAPAADGSAIEGESPDYGARKFLDIDIRGNDVLLCSRPQSGEGCDIAVGLDDFQDALEKVIAAA